MLSPILKKRYFLLVAVITFLVFAYDFLELRRSDEGFVKFLSQDGIVSKVEYLSKGGRSVRYITVGEKKDQLLVFVHGSPSSSAFWGYFLKDSTLLNNATLMAVDRPGYGYSGFGKIMTSVKKQAQFLAEIMRKERGNYESIVVLGSSYGGTVAVRMAMDYPDLVDGIILQSASVAPGEEKTYWITYPTSHPGLSWMIPTVFRVANAEKLSHSTELEKMLPYWSRVTTDVTILHGTEDGLVFPGNASFARDRLVNSRYVEYVMVEGRGHDLAWTTRPLIIDSILDSFNRINSKPVKLASVK